MFGLVKVWIIEVRIKQVFPWEFVREFWENRGISFKLVWVKFELYGVKLDRVDCKLQNTKQNLTSPLQKPREYLNIFRYEQAHTKGNNT